MSKSKRRSWQFGRQSRYESLEQRIVLDTQIGTVTMPYNGFLSVAVYDSDGQYVRNLYNREAKNAGTVTLTWDGRDDNGRLVFQDGSYSWKAVTSQTSSVEQGGIGDSQFGPLPGGGYMEANDTVDSIAINRAGGMIGEVGGIIARNDGETSFGDTTLTDLNGAAAGKMDLSTAMSGTGSFYYKTADHHTTDGNSFIGHYSSDTSDTRREFIGLEIKEAGNETLEVRARVFRPNGVGGDAGGVASGWILIPAGETFFEYTYNPNIEVDGGHAGPEGRLFINIYNSDHSFDQTALVNLDANTRDSGAFFDSFGIGTPTKANSDDNPAKTAKYFIDDATYTGNTGLVDFNTDPGWVGNGNTTNGNNYGWSSVNSVDGSVYQASPGEEGSALRRLAQDGSLIWAGGGFQFVGIAANAKYVFVSGKDGSGNDVVARFLARDGSPSGFSAVSTGKLTINSDSFDPRPEGQNAYTPEQHREEYSPWGMGADSRRVFVSNYRKDRVEVYNANTGVLLGQLTGIDKPLGITVEADGPSSGTIWVANSGNRVTRYTYNSSYAFTEGVSITGLNTPSGVSIGGPSNHLYVTEMGTGKVREYDITSTPTLAGLGATFGSLQTNHTVTDTQFAWNAPWVRWAGLAVDQSGIINVNDDRRIQRYYGTTGGGHNAGDLYQSWWGEFGPAPTDEFNYQPDGRYTLVDASYEYEVDPEYTGGPRPGWLGDGTWRVVSRYITDVGAGVRRTLNDNGTMRDYRFVFSGQSTVTAFQIDGPTDRKAAIVGLDNWTGVDGLQTPQWGKYNWTDVDGDGQIDWGGVGTGTSGEVTWTVPLGTRAQPNGYVLNAGWVDYSGNVWAIINKDIVKVPLEGFDAQHNPIYNWANAVTVVAFEDDDWDFMPRFARVAPNGDIYALGATKMPGNLSPTGGSSIHGGEWIARFDSNGNRKLLMPIVDHVQGDENPPVVVFDENDPNSNYFYTGVGEGAFFYMRQYTKDGLLVSRASSEDSGIETGWIDHQYGMGAFTHPYTGKLYMFGEDIVYGRSVPYLINGMNTVATQSGNFSLTVPHTPSGNWQFENNLNDSAGGYTGTFTGGSPSYAAGVSGNAIDLDGIDDSVNLPLTNDLGGYTVAGWIKATDTSNVNIISRTDATPTSYFQLRINVGGKLEHAAIEDNITRTVVSTTTVQTSNWYHVAIVATNDGVMRLYVNGQEEGVAQSIGTISPAGDRFRLGGAVGSFGNFDGLIDELKIYELPLSGAEIQTLFNQSGLTAVTVSATDSTASEQSQGTGTFRIARNGTSGNLVVSYSIGGSATLGSDYSSIAGSVTILNGQSAVNVTVTPINDTDFDPSETVVLTLLPNTNYLMTSPSSDTVVIVDDEATGDPGWVGVGNKSDANNYGWSYNTNNAAGATGEIGGTFARNDNESYYADTNLNDLFTMDDTLVASGKISIFNPINTDGTWFVGHLSSDIGDSSTIGIEFLEGDPASFRARALMSMPGSGGAEGDTISAPFGDYNFEYTYNPNLGPNGTVTFRLYNGTYDQSEDAQILVDQRFSGATFDAFGIGIRNRPGSGDAPGRTIETFIDDVNYTGRKPTVTVGTSDASAAEVGPNTGTFTITRNDNVGNLVVNYALTGAAVNGSDYSSLTGTVTIPNGQSSVNVTVTPINDVSPEGNEDVVLTLVGGSTYATGLPESASLTITDDDAGTNFIAFGSNPGWSGANRNVGGNNFGWSPSTNQAGGVTGETGGTFARSLADTYYADTFLSQTFNLNNSIQAFGKLDVLGITSGWAGSGDSGLFVGHFSTSAANREFIGLELKEDAGGLTTQVQVRARLQLPGGGGTAFSAWTTISVNGNHTFNYVYNPSLGTNGRLTVNIDAQAPLVVDLSAADRTSGAAFNAFGLGYTNNLNSENAVAKTAQLFIDDLGYSGFQSAVTVVATDASATEQGTTTGVYTITRTGTSGNLVVNYLVTGKATSGSDYAALPGSITILDGQTSANLTLTPINDAAAEGDETAILTITNGTGYYRGSPYQATVTIQDNDSVVTVSATDPSAAEAAANTGTFTITRSSTIGPATINFSIGGSATSGSDYSALPSSVTMSNGQSTATIVVTPIDDLEGDANETVILNLTASSAYTIGSPNSDTITITDNDVNNSFLDFSVSPNWTGVGNTINGNNYGYKPSSAIAGGGIGEVGGVFARNSTESYFADTNFSKTFNLSNVITASGRIDFHNSSADGSWFVGHISQNGADRSAIGIEFKEEDSTQVQFTARIMTPGGTGVTGAFRSTPVDGNYHFTYTYDPSLDTNGRLTVRIYNDSLTFDKTETISLSAAIRTSGATFNAFGVGILPGITGSDNPGATVEMYIDDVNYSGHIYASDGFETGNGNGGSGWGGSWGLLGTATVTSSGTPNTGSFHLQLTGTGASATRAVSLSGVTSARLVFDWKATSFEPGETAVVEVFDGTNWINMLTILDTQDDGVYHHADLTIPVAALTGNFQVRVKSLMSAGDDIVYIDDIHIAK